MNIFRKVTICITSNNGKVARYRCTELGTGLLFRRNDQSRREFREEFPVGAELKCEAIEKPFYDNQPT